MKLYYFKNACSLACRIVANYLEIPLEYETIKELQTKNKITETGLDFITISSKNQIPVLTLEDGKILTEVSAILLYLWESKKSLQSHSKYNIFEWLSFCSSELHKNFVPIISPIIPENAKPIFIKIFLSKLKFVNTFLEGKNFLVEEEFSIADAYLFVIISWLLLIKIDVNQFPAVSRYFKNLAQLSFIKKSLEDEKIILRN